MNRNICPTCGVPNNSDQSFCSNCGTRLNGNQSARPNGRPASRPPAASAPKKSRAGLYIGIVAGVGLLIMLIGAAGLGALYYFASRSEPEIVEQTEPAAPPRAVRDDKNSSDEPPAAKKDAPVSADLTEDEKYRLFYAASRAGEQALTLKVSKKIGIIGQNGVPTPYYRTFIGGMIDWTTRETDFVQKMDSTEKSLAYIKSQAPELLDSSK